MADRTLTINHADGGSETYTLKTEDVLGVRSMSVDGETVTIDRTAPDLVRSIIADGQTITIDTTREGVRTLTVDGTEITIDRTEESNLGSFIQQFTGSSLILSLKDRASTSGNTTVVRVRRSSDNAEADFKASEVSDGTLVAWVGAGNDGFVETWYDQSGNGNDATQSVAGSQPKIVDAGVLVSGGLEFDGVDDTLEVPYVDFGSNDFYINIVAQRVDASNTKYLFTMGQGGAGQEWVSILDFGATDPNLSMGGFFDDDVARLDADSNSGTKATEFLFSLARDVNTGRAFFNNNETTVDITTLGSLTNPNQYGRICAFRGATSDAGFSNYKVQELIIYDSNQSANRVGIETNINNQYDIY